jgi:mono/diheme cytochrome c family protein
MMPSRGCGPQDVLSYESMSPPALFLLTCLAASASSFAAAHGDPVTYTSDVAPLLERHCVECHRQGGSMPQLALDDYAAAQKAAATLLAPVAARTMPPWFADPKDSVAFRNDPRLTDDEIATLATWIRQGAQRGDAASAPPARSFDGWSHPQGRRPDAIVSFPRIDLPANGELPYVRVLIKNPLPGDRWIEALQTLPGNAAVVHHMAVAEVTLPSGVTPATVKQLDEVARRAGLPDGAFTQVQPAVVDPSDDKTYDMLAAYTPGSTFESYPAGAAKLLRGGGNDYVNFNIHYTTTGKPEADQSRLGLWFTDRPPRSQLFRAPMPGKTLIANGRELLTDAPGTKAEGTDFAIPPIAAFEAAFELTGVTAVLRPLTIYALQPHAHLRGSSFRYSAIWPDGHEQALLSVPHYDFHWQLTYELRDPLQLPAGSKIVASARYDNSSANRHLAQAALEDPAKRCGPDKIVHFRQQNQTWDEMFSPIVEYSIERVATSPQSAKLVRATGCVARETGNRWILRSIGRLEATGTQSTSAVEVAEMAKWPLGAQAVPIVAAQPFDLSAATNHRVAIKAIETDAAHATNLSLTSLQLLEGGCR